MAVGPIHLQGISVGDTSRMVWGWLFVTHPKRIFGIEVQYTIIFNIYLGHTVIGGGEEEIIIKPNLPRTWFELSIPVWPFARSSKPKVPLSNNRSFIPCFFEQISNRSFTRLDNRRSVRWSDPSTFSTKSIVSSKKGITGRGAGGCRAVTTGKPQSFLSQTINVWGF